jgi:hypothetical protein
MCRDQRALAEPLGGLADLAQPAVLFVERLEPQQLAPGDAELLGELGVLGAQPAAIGEAARQPGPQLIGRLHDGIDRVRGCAHPQPCGLEVAAAMIENHHDHGDDAEKEQAGTERRPATNDRAAVGA